MMLLLLMDNVMTKTVMTVGKCTQPLETIYNTNWLHTKRSVIKQGQCVYDTFTVLSMEVCRAFTHVRFFIWAAFPIVLAQVNFARAKR